MAELSRREWLTLVAGAAALPACTPSEPQRGVLGLMERANERAQRLLFRPTRLARVPSASVSSTGSDAFPPYFISETVPLAPPGWALSVGGMVARPRSFSLAELQRLPRTDIRVRHYCVEGWSAVASWHGVRLADLAAVVGSDPRAPYVAFRSFDQGYSSSWDRESALHPQTLLAYGMNGSPLGPDHGAPVRLYSGVKLGYKMVKYLTDVRFLPMRTGGYWEDQGYEWFAGV
ncbi:MAG: molybdopterin-dependent oxidoreductase [Deltaproteobacteria bacterium]